MPPRHPPVLLLLGAAWLVCAAATAAQPRAAVDSPRQVVLDYCAAVTQGDWERARRCWSPTELAHAERLGTRYRGVPIKIDTASPLILWRTALVRGEASVHCGAAVEEEGWARVEVAVRTPADSASVTYHLAPTAEGWRLVSPVTALAEGWPVRETAFLRLRQQPPRCLPQAAVARLDSAAARICRQLGASEARVETLRRCKIDYSYADSAAVEALALAPTVGVALLQTDAVVTSEPCHLHELAHLLVNFCAGEVGLFVAPLLLEGTAVHLGGRWGRAPDALGELGRYVLRERLLSLDDLLTWDGFQANPADLTYAPAGLVVGRLLDRLGAETFLTLYRALSGSLPEVRAITAEGARARLAAALGVPFAEFAADVGRDAGASGAGPLDPGLPGEGPAPPDTIAIVTGPGLQVCITRAREWLHFAVESADESASGALLMKPRTGAVDQCVFSAGRSFAKQLPGLEQRGEPVALIFDAGEIGLYDFTCDLLLAKHVEEFRPAPGYASDAGRRLRFGVRAALLPAAPEDLTWRLERRAGS